MPVRKFRSLEEMEDSVWMEPGDPKLAERIRAVWNFGHLTLKLQFPPGVYRSRSIEEANAIREEWDRANFEAHRRRLG